LFNIFSRTNGIEYKNVCYRRFWLRFKQADYLSNPQLLLPGFAPENTARKHYHRLAFRFGAVILKKPKK